MPFELRLVKYASAAALLDCPDAAAPLDAAENPGIWSVAAQMTAARTETGAVVVNGKIYLAGGQEMWPPDSTLFQLFDPADGSWKKISLRCLKALPIPV